jgi:secondary thiamine-phosphate synthase enzyme
MITQFELRLSPKSRGFHLVTDEIMSYVILPEAGFIHIFIKHTSAALTINENADRDVRIDFETMINRLVPENQPNLSHTLEGVDDMPAHIKASLFGSSIMIPISNGRLNLGIWQGIYLCEFRNRGGSRSLVVTTYQ